VPIKRFLLEAVSLVALAAICATVSNFFAARERKLAWSSTYGATPVRMVRPAELQRQLSAPVMPATPAPAVTSAQPAVPATTSEAAPKPAARPAPAPPPATTSAPAPAKPAVSAIRTFPPHPDKPLVELMYPDVRYLYDHKAPFIDARRTDVYAQGHIAGAMSMPVWESDIDQRVKKVYEENWPADAPVVVYCSGGDCEDSHMLAQKLWGIGLNDILVYKDGFPDWQNHGGPVHEGPNR
jgi:rhodanese-related sulfurtransferase